MKKFFGILLAFVMLLVIAPGAYAASQTTLNFNLTCDGENSVSKTTGDIITVTFTLENATEKDTAYDISSLTNEIYYDHNFFELVEGSSKVETGLNLTTKLAVYSWGEHRVYFNGFEIPAKQYASTQTIGTFQLKIIADEGSSTIRSVGMVASGSSSYGIASKDLTVRIGDAPVTPVYELSFETNGGSPVFSVKQEEGTAVDLTGYVPVKSGYVFEGWYSDEELENKVTSVILSDNTTVYAKWVKKSNTAYYTLSFETNGGSIISDIEKEAGGVINLTGYIPEKDGYVFEGWYSEEELENKITSVSLNSDMTVYAKWIESDDSNPGVDTSPDTDVNDTPNTEDYDFIWQYIMANWHWLWWVALIALVVIIIVAWIILSDD